MVEKTVITQDGYRVIHEEIEYEVAVEDGEGELAGAHDRLGEGRSPDSLPNEVIDELRERHVSVGGDSDDAADDGGDVEGNLTDIDGVGPSRAELLRRQGIETRDDIIDVGAEALVEAGLPEFVVENIVESA